jgi:ABC-type multidrug transport system fused ATPase/permease subunit
LKVIHIRFSELWDLFDLDEKKKLLELLFYQLILNFLDLFGLACLWIIGLLSVKGVASLPPEGIASNVLRLLHLDQVTFQGQVAILATVGGTLLTLKTLLSMNLNTTLLRLLAKKTHLANQKMLNYYFTSPVQSLYKNSIEKIIKNLTQDLPILYLFGIGGLFSAAADISLLILLVFSLVILNPFVTLFSSVFFLILGFALYRYMSVRSAEIGAKSSLLTLTLSKSMTSMYEAYRELVVRNEREIYLQKLDDEYLAFNTNNLERAVLPSVSKYVYEMALVLGVLMMAAIEFLLLDASNAVGELAFFLAASARIAPAGLRIQQYVIQARDILSRSSDLVAILLQLKDTPQALKVIEPQHEHDGVFELCLEDLSYMYQDSKVHVFENINFQSNNSTTIGILGPSGVGKSTLVDLICGVTEPTSGSVRINGVNPVKLILTNPGVINYVPQKPLIVNSTLRENILLGSNLKTDIEILALAYATGLDSILEKLPNGLDTMIGSEDFNLSGGQKQCIGLVRALITRPGVLILDESTNAMDPTLEQRVLSEVKKIMSSNLLILVSHSKNVMYGLDIVLNMTENGLLNLNDDSNPA